MRKPGEFELIEKIGASFTAIPPGLKGIGDDCAIIPQADGLDSLISTDMLIEGTHFLLGDVKAWELGWKSAAVNISDIAAMGGKPVATFLSFALPFDLEAEWLDDFVAGYKAISDKYDVPLLGGDTTSSNGSLAINVAILGSCPKGSAVLRSGAKAGDRICVTGNLGDSAAGLKVILDGLERDDLAQKLVSKHYLPVPRVQEGQILRSCPGVHSMMDISDGIASDLGHILKASGVGAKVYTDRLPLSDELKSFSSRYGCDILQLALGGGEDYELLFTLDPSYEPSTPYVQIGEIIEDKTCSIKWIGSEIDYKGFCHF